MKKLGYDAKPVTSRAPPKKRARTEATCVMPIEIESPKPSVNEGDHEAYTVRCDCTPLCTCSGCVDKQKTIIKLQHDTDKLQEQLDWITNLYKQRQKQNRITLLRFLRTDKATRIYTGLPTKQAFHDLFQYVKNLFTQNEILDWSNKNHINPC